MMKPYEQLDQRFAELKSSLPLAERPQRGWIRAIRTALGMRTGQMAKRMNVSQPRINELEKAEIQGSITLSSLERAAQALGCRVVYAFVPERPLADTIRDRAYKLAEQKLASVEQTMRLEAQEVTDKRQRQADLRQLAETYIERSARLWDEA
jgi:predicted DNA-binding mobile mystery protein A